MTATFTNQEDYPTIQSTEDDISEIRQLQTELTKETLRSKRMMRTGLHGRNSEYNYQQCLDLIAEYQSKILVLKGKANIRMKQRSPPAKVILVNTNTNIQKQSRVADCSIQSLAHSTSPSPSPSIVDSPALHTRSSSTTRIGAPLRKSFSSPALGPYNNEQRQRSLTPVPIINQETDNSYSVHESDSSHHTMELEDATSILSLEEEELQEVPKYFHPRLEKIAKRQSYLINKNNLLISQLQNADFGIKAVNSMYPDLKADAPQSAVDKYNSIKTDAMHMERERVTLSAASFLNEYKMNTTSAGIKVAFTETNTASTDIPQQLVMSLNLIRRIKRHLKLRTFILVQTFKEKLIADQTKKEAKAAKFQAMKLISVEKNTLEYQLNQLKLRLNKREKKEKTSVSRHKVTRTTQKEHSRNQSPNRSRQSSKSPPSRIKQTRSRTPSAKKTVKFHTNEFKNIEVRAQPKNTGRSRKKL